MRIDDKDKWGVLVYCSATNLPGSFEDFVTHHLKKHMNLGRNLKNHRRSDDFTLVLMSDVDMTGPDQKSKIAKARRSTYAQLSASTHFRCSQLI